ncbi:MAG: aspartate dehydrogenase [Candidatus Omnitrophica bacterium]|nr:aspartate dehydrogenase [Candidatus Omnitrophota bacterium]
MKRSKLKIGIVGCGAIGTSLAKAISTDFSDKAELASLYDADVEKSFHLAGNSNRKAAALNLEDLLNKVDLVIESAKADSAFEVARKAMYLAKDVLVMSVGGIAEHYGELAALAKEKGGRLFVPSGAICGIDGIKAANCGKINKVVLTTKKPPKAFLGVRYILKNKIRLDNIDKDTVIFEGSAYSATKLFPQNINVAATLSLAGIGLEKTLVRIVASPGLKQNMHEIEVESDSGTIFVRCANLIHPSNPKTSYLAVLSAIATLKKILEPVSIGT